MDVALSIAALVVSIAVGIVQYLQWRSSGSRVSVLGGQALIHFPDGTMRSCLTARVINKGQGIAVVSDWGFIDPNGRYAIGPDVAGEWSYGPDTPKVLSPEEPSAFWCLDYHYQKAKLSAEHPGVPHLLQAYVRLATNEMIMSKEICSVDGHLAPRSLRARLERRRTAGIGAIIFKKTDSGKYFLQLTATGPSSAKKILVELVKIPATVADHPEQIWRRSYLRAGHAVDIPIPERVFADNHWFRIGWQSAGNHSEFRIGSPSDTFPSAPLSSDALPPANHRSAPANHGVRGSPRAGAGKILPRPRRTVGGEKAGRPEPYTGGTGARAPAWTAL